MSDFQGRCRRCMLLSLLTIILVGGVANQVSAQIMDSPAEKAQQRLAQQIQKAKPQSYQITSQILLNQGTQSGYLVVEVQLAAGKHIYALTQVGIPPTVLKMLPNPQAQLTGPFSPDKPAVVIEDHPVFNRRVEKHTGTVQFFAPITVSPTADLAKLTVDVQFDGQVCSQNACVPIRGKKITSKFAGYFQSTPASASLAKQPSSQQPSGSNTRVK